MADRFPSIEELDAGQTGKQGVAAGDTDGADFLAREQAALGEDAKKFSTPGDGFKMSATMVDDDDDLLGGGSTAPALSGGEAMEFQTAFPAIDMRNEHIAPGGTITGLNDPYVNRQPTPAYSAMTEDEEEPDVIRQWREKRDDSIQKRDEADAAKKTETIKAANENIDEFYENYNSKKEKSLAATKKEAEDFLAKREDTSAGGTSWERIAKLVDLSGKGVKGGASGTGKERFRELLLSLRKDEKAPGASGYAGTD